LATAAGKTKDSNRASPSITAKSPQRLEAPRSCISQESATPVAPPCSVRFLRARYDGCKPCLHGSDSHDQTSVGQPADNRFSWIKGALEFDALRQACIDPQGRAYVGAEPPRSALPSQVISDVKINDAAWATTPDIPLNPGLVAVIGGRGSGKTALAWITTERNWPDSERT
jgi:hypothetical protein